MNTRMNTLTMAARHQSFRRRIAAAFVCASLAVAGGQPAGAAPASAAGSPAPAHDVATAAFAARLRARQPGTRVDEVRVSPIPGVFEVAMGRNVAYVSSDARYALFGHLWDMEQQRDLTADRAAPAERADAIDVGQLPKALAFERLEGSGRRTLYLFADPHCGYCRQLDKALAEVRDIRIHTFVLPVLGAESRARALAILCAPDATAAWATWMREGTAPPAVSTDGSAPCEERLAATEQLGRALGISATPTLVSADGRRRVGAMSASALVGWLDADGQVTAPRKP